ncbi:MAG: DUF898 family protein [Salinarimonas sp.]|nr:DUF898 family protein [Salinarimonas sp.]
MAVTNAQAGVTFTGKRAAFAGLLARGSLLTLPTLGLYRFWLVTDIRRHLYGNTLIAGEPLEYAGRGGELLRGFLIGMAVLIPINLLLTLLGLTSFGNSGALLAPIFVGLMMLQHFAQFRTFAYRVTRTRYRGIAGSLDADFGGYLTRRLGWDSAAVLSLGLAIPFRRAALDRYLIGNCRLGDQKAQFTGSGWGLAWRVYFGWAITLLVWLVIAVLSVPLLASLIAADAPELDELREVMTGSVLWIIATVVVGFTFYAVYVAIWQRWRLNHLSFGTTRFVSALRARQVVGCYLRFGLSVLAVLFCVLALATVGSVILTDHYPEESLAVLGTWEDPTMLRNAIMIGSILLMLTLIGAARRYFVERGVWLAVTSTLSVAQPQALIERLRYSEPRSAGAGEGLADAFTLGP